MHLLWHRALHIVQDGVVRRFSVFREEVSFYYVSFIGGIVSGLDDLGAYHGVHPSLPIVWHRFVQIDLLFSICSCSCIGRLLRSRPLWHFQVAERRLSGLVCHFL